MVRVAFEGPSCAGKTTLAMQLAYSWRGSVVIVPDQSAELGRWGVPRPDLPAALATSERDEELALARLLRFERERYTETPFDQVTLAIIDRSALSLISHCAGLDRVQGTDSYERLAATAVGRSDAAVWPTHVVYVDVAPDVQRSRYGVRQPPLFADPRFNAGIRDYFGRLAADEAVPVLWLDSAWESRDLIDRIMTFLPAASGETGDTDRTAEALLEFVMRGGRTQ